MFSVPGVPCFLIRPLLAITTKTKNARRPWAEHNSNDFLGGSMHIRKLLNSLLPRAARQPVAILGLLLGFTLAAAGQQITGSIVGTVKDQQGAVVNTATI